jgi:ATP-binding cassette subfamily G (WHITE) protein 2 (SNQ2)
MAGQDNTTKSASRVSLDHFDPEGVRELSRTLSRPSPQLKRRSTRSDQTLAAEEPFSLERTLRAALERYGCFVFTIQPSLTRCRQHGSDVKRRELGVYFSNLRVIGGGATASQQATVGSMINPKVIWQECRNSLRPSTRTLLHDFNGVVRPGEMLRKFIRRSRDV